MNSNISRIGNLSNISQLLASANTKLSEIGELKRVKISKIIPDPHQPRKEFSDASLQELGDSIEKEGLIQPVIVDPEDESGNYMLLEGERRWRTYKARGWDEIDVIIKKYEISPTSRMKKQLIVNLQREKVSLIDTSNTLQLIIDTEPETTHLSLAKELGKSRVWVTKMLSLQDLPECIRTLVEAEKIKDLNLLYGLRTVHFRNNALGEEFCALAAKGLLTRSQVEAALLKADDTEHAKMVEQHDLDSDSTVRTQSEQNNESSNRDETPQEKLSGDGFRETNTDGQDKSPNNQDLDPDQDPEVLERNFKKLPEQEDGKAERPDGKTWKFVKPQSVIITVNVLMDDNTQQRAILDLERVDKEQNVAWVKMADGKEIKNVRVTLNQISVIGIEG